MPRKRITLYDAHEKRILEQASAFAEFLTINGTIGDARVGNDPCILLKLGHERLISIVAFIQEYADHKPDFHHGQHVPLLFQLADLIADLSNRLMPADEYLVFCLDIKVSEPFPDCMGLGIITALDGLQQVLDLAFADSLRRVVALFKCDIPSERIQGANSGFYLVNTALVILQQRAAHLIANRLQANNRHSGVVTDMGLAVLGKELGRRQI